MFHPLPVSRSTFSDSPDRNLQQAFDYPAVKSIRQMPTLPRPVASASAPLSELRRKNERSTTAAESQARGPITAFGARGPSCRPSSQSAQKAEHASHTAATTAAAAAAAFCEGPTSGRPAACRSTCSRQSSAMATALRCRHCDSIHGECHAVPRALQRRFVLACTCDDRLAVASLWLYLGRVCGVVLERHDKGQQSFSDIGKCRQMQSISRTRMAAHVACMPEAMCTWGAAFTIVRTTSIVSRLAHLLNLHPRRQHALISIESNQYRLPAYLLARLPARKTPRQKMLEPGGASV